MSSMGKFWFLVVSTHSTYNFNFSCVRSGRQFGQWGVRTAYKGISKKGFNILAIIKIAIFQN